MVKHTQTIRRQEPTNCLSVFDHFVGLALNGLRAAFGASKIHERRFLNQTHPTAVSLFQNKRKNDR